jgi:hypothetical protein
MTDSALTQPEVTADSSEHSDLGIVAYAVQLSSIWQQAARYVHRRGKMGALPPWSAESEYAKIMARLMEQETQFPYKYRFRPARFAEQTPQDLDQARDFWSLWLLVQMLYHSILCLLNHPLLLSLRLRNFKVTQVPEIFLQHTADLTATHTRWIVHLLELCKEKNFKVTNPFLVHCVAIVATIYLQQSCTDDISVRSEKQDHLQKCLEFLRTIGSSWPYIHQMVGQPHK